MEVAMSKNERLHREMWHWIAEETRKQKRKVRKYEYFQQNRNIPVNECFACAEAMSRWTKTHNGDTSCQYCPLKWGTEEYGTLDFCIYDDALFNQWMKIGAGLSDWQVAADLADRIAEMEWR